MRRHTFLSIRAAVLAAGRASGVLAGLLLVAPGPARSAEWRSEDLAVTLFVGAASRELSDPEFMELLSRSGLFQGQIPAELRDKPLISPEAAKTWMRWSSTFDLSISMKSGPVSFSIKPKEFLNLVVETVAANSQREFNAAVRAFRLANPAVEQGLLYMARHAYSPAAAHTLDPTLRANLVDDWARIQAKNPRLPQPYADLRSLVTQQGYAASLDALRRLLAINVSNEELARWISKDLEGKPAKLDDKDLELRMAGLLAEVGQEAGRVAVQAIRDAELEAELSAEAAQERARRIQEQRATVQVMSLLARVAGDPVLAGKVQSAGTGIFQVVDGIDELLSPGGLRVAASASVLSGVLLLADQFSDSNGGDPLQRQMLKNQQELLRLLGSVGSEVVRNASRLEQVRTLLDRLLVARAEDRAQVTAQLRQMHESLAQGQSAIRAEVQDLRYQSARANHSKAMDLLTQPEIRRRAASGGLSDAQRADIRAALSSARDLATWQAQATVRPVLAVSTIESVLGAQDFTAWVEPIVHWVSSDAVLQGASAILTWRATRDVLDPQRREERRAELSPQALGSALGRRAIQAASNPHRWNEGVERFSDVAVALPAGEFDIGKPLAEICTAGSEIRQATRLLEVAGPLGHAAWESAARQAGRALRELGDLQVRDATDGRVASVKDMLGMDGHHTGGLGLTRPAPHLSHADFGQLAQREGLLPANGSPPAQDTKWTRSTWPTGPNWVEFSGCVTAYEYEEWTPAAATYLGALPPPASTRARRLCSDRLSEQERRAPFASGSMPGTDDLAFEVTKQALAENLKQIVLREPAASSRVVALRSPTGEDRHAVVRAMKARLAGDLQQAFETALKGAVPAAWRTSPAALEWASRYREAADTMTLAHAVVRMAYRNSYGACTPSYARQSASSVVSAALPIGVPGEQQRLPGGRVSYPGEPEAIDGPVIVAGEAVLAAQERPDLASDWIEQRLAAYEKWRYPPFIDAWTIGNDCSADVAAVSQGIQRLRALLVTVDMTPPPSCRVLLDGREPLISQLRRP
ncbi:MAG: hypothetical protein KDF54_07225 [Hydrogenophaga sp.]|nr:hypothetical protein [Hydrogenophaga sp.]